MKIRFTAQASAGQGAPGELADRARRRLRLRLCRCSERVAHISVRFGENGQRSVRQDSYCVMQVQMHGALAATVVQIGADAYSTIDRAADRVGRLAEEQLRVATDAPPMSAGAGELVPSRS